MLGIKIKGENAFEISPVIGEGVDFAKGSYRSLYGEVAVSWRKENGKVNFEIEVPANTTAAFIFKDKLEQLEPGTHHLAM